MTPDQDRFYIRTAKLAYWYFRLNGFMTIENFVVHPKLREQPGQKTDADLYGVRFPQRKELDFPDDECFERKNVKPLFVIAEFARGQCKLNGPWTSRKHRNIEYVLNAIGAFPRHALDDIANSLYGKGKFDGEFEVQLICVGNSIRDEYKKQFPELLQITIEQILRFIYERFGRYREQKADHSQWDESGKLLWDKSEAMSRDQFVQYVSTRLT